MKVKLVIILFVGLGVLLSSCEEISTKVTPSNNISTQIKSVGNYSGLHVSNAFTVFVEFSESEESIEIEANDNLHQYIDVYTSGDKLIIKLKDNINIKNGHATLKAYVTTKYLSEFDASGASSITLQDELITSDCSVELSGASFFRGDVNVGQLSMDVSGASIVDIAGKTTDCYIDASGASSIKDYSLNVDFLNVDLSGASNVYLTVYKELDVEASGASSVYFKGDGLITHQNLSGASNVHRTNN